MKPSTRKILEQISKETGIPIDKLVEKFRQRSLRTGVPFDDTVEIYWVIREKTKVVRQNGI